MKHRLWPSSEPPAACLFVLLALLLIVAGPANLSEAATRAPVSNAATAATPSPESSSTFPVSRTDTNPSGEVKEVNEQPGSPTAFENLLVTAPIYLSDTEERPENALRAAVDDDPRTALALSPGGRLELRFAGAPRWLDRVELESSGGGLEILIRDWHHTEILIGTARSGDREVELFTFTPVPCEAVLLRAPSGSAPAHLFEVGAAFDSRDPDDQGLLPSDDSRREVVVEWINNYPGSSNDLSKCDDDARGLKNALPGWYKYEYSNGSVWEDDFKRVPSGGQENRYTDPRDMVYFSGHGSSKWDWKYWRTNRSLWFSGNRDDKHLVPGDAHYAWGDDDMEWICFASCQVLKDDSYWANAMRKLHLMMGWRTNMSDVNLGGPFGNYMVKNGTYDTALKIKASWFQAAEDTHGSGRTARVAGETSSMGNDYIWGQGVVQPDPSVNRYFTRWNYSTSKDALAGLPALDAGPEGMDLATVTAAPGPLEQQPRSGLVRIPAQTPRGHAVAYDPAIASLLPLTMNRFHVQPVPVDPFYVQEIASRLCMTMGRMCAGEIGPDGEGNLWMTEGTDALLVSEETGAVTLLDTELWLAERTVPANLPSPTAARADAEALLTMLDRLPEGGVPNLVSWFVSEEVDRDTHGTVSTLEQNIQVNFERDLEGYLVHGPGANVAVVYGDNGYLERWSEGGWRTAISPEPVSLIELPEIMSLLATHGSDCTINGITVPVGEITVHSVSNGYYEFDRWTPQPLIEPIYVLETTITFEDTDPVDYTIFINGVGMPPTGSIIAPPDSIWFNEGDPIPFEGTATGGTPPYTFEWTSDFDGHLGSGPSIVTPLGVAFMDSILVFHSVTLEVTDSMGMSCHTTHHVGVRSLTDIDDHDVGEVILTVTDQGTIGFTDDTQSLGSGFVFAGSNLLFVGGAWLGTSPAYVANREYSAEPAQDWTVSVEPDGHLLFGGQLYSDQDGYAYFDDAGHPAPRGSEVGQHSWAFAVDNPSIPEQRGIIFNYMVLGPEDMVEPEAYFGVFLDLDINDANQNEGRVRLPVAPEDGGGPDQAWGYVSMWHGTGPYVGLALLSPETPANLTLIHNPTYVWPNQYVSDEDKFLFLSAGDPDHVLHQSTAPDDWSILASAGPFDRPPRGRAVAFGLAAADSEAELEINLAALKARYDELMAGIASVFSMDAPRPVTRLLGALPNPFNPTTRIRFELADRESVRLRIYDTQGRVVSTLLDGEIDPGLHTIPWDGRASSGQEVVSGVYFLQLETESTTATSKAVVIR